MEERGVLEEESSGLDGTTRVILNCIVMVTLVISTHVVYVDCVPILGNSP